MRRIVTAVLPQDHPRACKPQKPWGGPLIVPKFGTDYSQSLLSQRAVYGLKIPTVHASNKNGWPVETSNCVPKLDVILTFVDVVHKVFEIACQNLFRDVMSGLGSTPC